MIRCGTTNPCASYVNTAGQTIRGSYDGTHCTYAPSFVDSGNNLTVTLPITFSEAALGGDIEVPTIDGSMVTLRLRPGTPSGSRHRVKGKGISVSSKRDGETTGDLIVTVEVDVPAQLTDEQRAAVEQLAAATTVNPRTNR